MLLLLTQAAALVLLVLLLAPDSLQLAAQSNSKPGCPNTCGNLTIPYPFGLSGLPGCQLGGDAFTIDCNTSVDGPPVAYWWSQSTNIQITNISIIDHEMWIKVYVAHDCYNSSGREGSSSPYLQLVTFPISNTRNTFTAVGCDTYSVFKGHKGSSYAMGCLSLCNNITDVTNGACSGIGCCQSSIPRNVTQYNITLSSYNNHSDVLEFNPCSYAFVAEKGFFNFSTDYLQSHDMTDKMVPLVRDWAIGSQTCVEAQKNEESFVCKENTTCTDAENGSGYRCHCEKGYQGNPYLSGSGGCQDVDECKTSNPCSSGTSSCINLPGGVDCKCHKGYEGNGFRNSSGCSPIVHPKKYTSRDIALGVGMSCLVVLLCASWLVWGLRQRKETKAREKFFKDNGGVMLQGVETLKVFTADELKRATDNYHESRILGQGGQGTVYKGTVMNNRTVAIKKAKLLDRSQVKDFINEIIVLSQINHKNVVKMIGCCLETELPQLVYEFVTNGSLSEHLHDNGEQYSTSLSTWEARLRVAAETSGALSYLHSDASIPIFHRDVKSANILLDENYTAKVADFGASRLIPSDRTQISTIVQGTFGYLDPEYFHSSQLTEKSDVYSFGVVLAELLTGMKAISFDKPERERTLALFFVLAVKEDRCLEIIDKRIINEGNADHIREVGVLASKCLKLRGEDRPSMKEVALELEGLVRATDTHPWMHHDYSENFQESEYLLGGFHIECSDSGAITTAASEDTIKHILLPFHTADAR